jgi:cell division protein ZapA (FtsZ GTPase activity inhibitor)
VHCATLLALGLVLCGCGLTTSQRAAVRSFSEATAALGEVTGREFIQMRDDTIAMNQRHLALTSPGSDPVGSLEGQFTVEAVTVRVQATGTIRTYGELLQALVDDTQEKELQTAADRFMASVRGLPKANRALKEEQIAALGKLVQEVGGLIVEAKKRAAIKQIVPSASEQIDTLCDLLAGDFDPDQPKLAAQYLIVANRLSVDADTAVRRATDPTARTDAAAAFQLAQASRTRLATLVKQASDAVKQLKAANRALAQAVAADEVTREDLIAYVTTVRTLVETAKVLR